MNFFSSFFAPKITEWLMSSLVLKHMQHEFGVKMSLPI